MLTKEQTDAYFSRIGYDGDRTPNLTNLCAIQRAHLFAVPYETLDIVLRHPLSLEIPALYSKIVLRRRGGYCFELNALYAELLRTLGYSVRLHFARFLRNETGIPMRRHEILSVMLPEGRFVCDVGVGARIPLTPVRLSDEPQVQERGTWFFEEDALLGHVLCERTERGDVRTCSFTDEPCFPIDFLTTSFYCEHSPDSVFRGGAILALRVPEGRNFASSKTFRVYEAGELRTFDVQTETEYLAAIQKYFRILI